MVNMRNVLLLSLGSVLLSCACGIPRVSNDVVENVDTVRTHGGPHHHPDACSRAYAHCDFAFHSFSSVPTFFANGKQDRAFTTRIISKDGTPIGILNTNGITPEFIAADGTATPITAFGSQPFTPTSLKPYPIKHHGKHMARGSGIGHQTYHGDQAHIVRHKCVRVYFTTYQVMSTVHPRRVVGNINVGKHDNKCVVFRTS